MEGLVGEQGEIGVLLTPIGILHNTRPIMFNTEMLLFCYIPLFSRNDLPT